MPPLLQTGSSIPLRKTGCVAAASEPKNKKRQHILSPVSVCLQH
jgi:hypothetical protein